MMLCVATLNGFGASKNFVIVLDPGHGGKDYGAIGKITNEKTINLSVAKQLGEMIEKEYDDVSVVFTRKSDKFISLKERAEIANKAGGDLFISIHVNSVDKKSKNRTTVKGASVYTLGLHKSASNLEVAKRENSVITLESDYSTNYQGFDPSSTESYIMFEMSQNKHVEQSVFLAQEIENQLIDKAGRADKGVRQAGFWVLWATSMPSVLVELDFICNPTQEKYMNSEKGQKEMATSIFNAFKRYKSTYDKSLTTPVVTGKTKSETHKESKKEKETKKEKEKRKKKQKKNEDKYPEATADRDIFDEGAVIVEHPAEETAPSVKKASSVETETAVAAETAIASDPEPVAPEKPKATTGKRYKVQFLTSPKQLEKGSKLLKGLYPVSYYKDGGLWKYTYGDESSWKEAEKVLKKVRSKFPDAFIVTMVDGKRQ